QRRELPGLLNNWHDPPICAHRFAVIDNETQTPVGLVEWQGTNAMADPSWWIGIKQRGYGKRAVELLAAEMVRQGVTSLTAGIRIHTLPGCGYYQASTSLAKHLRRVFQNLRGHD